MGAAALSQRQDGWPLPGVRRKDRCQMWALLTASMVGRCPWQSSLISLFSWRSKGKGCGEKEEEL